MNVALVETIRIESENRWDAVDLLQRLHHHHTYLVQLGDSRWHVCVRAEEDVDDVLGEVLHTASAWASDRQVSSVVRVADRSYALPA